MSVPTRDEFRRATGRNLFGGIFKKNDRHINRAIKLLGDYDPLRNQTTHAEEEVLRKIRRTAISWIRENPDDIPRVSRPEVVNLALQVNMRLEDIAEDLHGGPTHHEELRRAVERRKLVGATVGKTVQPQYKTEWKGLHWGVHQNTFGPLDTAALKNLFAQANTRLPFDRWVQYVLLPQNEDDPTCVFFGGVRVPGQRLAAGAPAMHAAEMKKKMLRMLNARERRDYVVTFRGGKAYGASGTVFDTGNFESLHRGLKWGIFVIAPDGTWYSSGHVINHFHHSSFLAGSRVLCAGEIKVEKGDLKELTNKTGHYHAGPAELTLALQRLQTAGIRISRVDVRIFDGVWHNPVKGDAALAATCDPATLGV